MSMYCDQCQEAAKNDACTVVGICGKDEEVSNLQDLFVYLLQGTSIWATKARDMGLCDEDVDLFIIEGLFSTITNVNFDSERFISDINKAFQVRESIKKIFLDAYREEHGKEYSETVHDSATWIGVGKEEFLVKALSVSLLSIENEDIRSLSELLLFGVKGMAAYADHAFILKYKDDEIFAFVEKALSELTRADISADELLGLVMEAGEVSVKTMALLDEANSTTFGDQEISEVTTGLQEGPAILVSGHDLPDLEELLRQTEGKGINIYTHGEMLTAHAYPELKKYDHLAGNFGTAWFNQAKEFEQFGGAILFTTNCIVEPKKSYRDRLFTTGLVGWPGIKHIEAGKNDNPKDFTLVIEKALSVGSVAPKEGKSITIGFAKNQVMALADKVIDAVKSGAIKQFVVMGGCDGRHNSREYYTDFAKALPEDTVILTAGCAKFRYNMLDLGDIGGIPRVLDAGQCNDSYSLAYIALQLKEAFGLDDINDLPISYNIAWYEQKAVTVLLALLHLGVKGIKLGPTLPAFLSPGVAKVLVEKFDIRAISSPDEDIAEMLDYTKAA